MELILYGHDDCSLCDRLQALLDLHLAEHSLTLTKRNINDDPAWRKAYRHRIPVLVADGSEVLEGKPTDEEVDCVVALLVAG